MANGINIEDFEDFIGPIDGAGVVEAMQRGQEEAITAAWLQMRAVGSTELIQDFRAAYMTARRNTPGLTPQAFAAGRTGATVQQSVADPAVQAQRTQALARGHAAATARGVRITRGQFDNQYAVATVSRVFAGTPEEFAATLPVTQRPDHPWYKRASTYLAVGAAAAVGLVAGYALNR